MARIAMTVRREGAQDIQKYLHAPCSVADALQALRLVGEVQDANQTTLRAQEIMQAGQYVLTIATSELPFIDVSVNSSHLILQERC